MKTIILKEGERFGRLTIIREVEPKKYGKRGNIRQFLCKCDCENETIVGMNNLRYGITRSCGCLRKELNKGYIEDCLDKPQQSRLHNIWLAMRIVVIVKRGRIIEITHQKELPCVTNGRILIPFSNGQSIMGIILHYQ